MQPWSRPLAGRFEQVTVSSPMLAGNPLGDPHERPLTVYLPPGYDDSPRKLYPTIYATQGYSGHAGMWFNRAAFRDPFPHLVDAVFADPDVPPAIVVLVDGWTTYGGSQFLDSPATGRYHSYLCEDVVSHVDTNYRTIRDREYRAITGKSSGGYCAMVTPMLRPDVFGALATHAGDALFDVGYRAELPRRARMLRDEYGGSYENFLTEFRQWGSDGRIAGTKASDIDLIEVYAYAAAYSADDDGTIHVPFDRIGALVPDVWERWRAWDPVVMASQEKHAAALRSLRAAWIDAGDRDEYFLDIGAAAFHNAVRAAGLPDDRIHFELFPAGHGAIEYRYPLAIRWLSHQLS